MSAAAMSWAFAARGLRPSAKLCLVALSNYAGCAEGICGPSREGLKLATGLSDERLLLALHELTGEFQADGGGRFVELLPSPRGGQPYYRLEMERRPTRIPAPWNEQETAA